MVNKNIFFQLIKFQSNVLHVVSSSFSYHIAFTFSRAITNKYKRFNEVFAKKKAFYMPNLIP